MFARTGNFKGQNMEPLTASCAPERVLNFQRAWKIFKSVRIDLAGNCSNFTQATLTEMHSDNRARARHKTRTLGVGALEHDSALLRRWQKKLIHSHDLEKRQPSLMEGTPVQLDPGCEQIESSKPESLPPHLAI